MPFGDRFSWIKGELEFDSLRQACIDPRGRSYVGAEPPSLATPSQVISEIEVIDSPWMQTPVIPLNAGLVAIIGARGSGKTALADVIAAGGDSISEEAWAGVEAANPSFLVRAQSLLADGKVKITWAAGDPITRCLNGSDANGPMSYARVQYLSQQFVEELCSSSGMTDELLREIERVIFEAHPDQERDGALDFVELLEHRASWHRLARQREAETVSQISERIGVEFEKEKLVLSLEAQVGQKKRLVDAHTADQAKLVSAGSEEKGASTYRGGRGGKRDQNQPPTLHEPKAGLPCAPGRGEGPSAQSSSRGLASNAGAAFEQRYVGRIVGSVTSRLQGQGEQQYRGLFKMGGWRDCQIERDVTSAWRPEYAALSGRRRPLLAIASGAGGRVGTAREAGERG